MHLLIVTRKVENGSTENRHKFNNGDRCCMID